MGSKDWSEAALDQWRQHTDPLADALIRGVIDEGPAATAQVSRLFTRMVTNSDPIPEDLPEPLKAYFAETEALPDWADPDKLKLGASLFNSHGPLIVLLLFTKALPLAYGCAKGAEVLVSTGRLTRDAANSTDDGFEDLNRRIMETAQFILNVMAPGGFEPGGRAIRTSQKIRLIHASIRGYLSEGNWDTARYDQPINQEDMAGTLMSFSYSMLEGMTSIGIDYTEDEAEAYLHTWCVVGHYIGLDEALMPDSMAEAKVLTEAILDSQTVQSDAGIRLTRSLVGYLREMIPGWLFDRMPYILIREQIGDQRADLLKIGGKWFIVSRLVVWVMEFFIRTFDTVQDDLPLVRRLYEKASRWLLQSLTDVHNGYKDVRFYIPPSLQEDWGIAEDKKK